MNLGRLRKLGGKLLKIGGKLAKCTACCGVGCTQAVYAQACYLTPGENCEITEPLGFWVCADDSCDSAPSSPFRDGPTTIYIDGKCFRTQAEVVDIAELEPGTDVQIAGVGGWSCRPTCEHEDCGIAPEVCGCTCHVYYGPSDPPGDNEFCCYGQYDTDGNLDSFNWTRTGHILQTSVSTKFVPQILASCAERDCDNEASCTIFESTTDSEEASGDHYGCCLDKYVRTRTLVSRASGCCDNPNTADGSVTGETIETWCGQYVPRISTSVTDNFLVPGNGPGCLGGSYIVTTHESDCASYVITIVEDAYQSHSYDGGTTCACQNVQHYESTTTYTFTGSTTPADQALCDQCRGEYAA